MTREVIIRNLKYTMEKHKNDTVNTFGTNISVMCKDILDYLEQEPCKDAVSRASVFETLGNLMSIPYDFDRQITEKDVSESMDEIKSLPPVTPTRKKGKWVKSNIGGAKVCSICQTHMGLSNFKFCPNCGAEMEGEE